MVTLYHFNRIWEIPDGSPFCVKLETYLRMANIEYKTDTTYDIRKAPKGKMPLIEHKGNIIADSSVIINYLKQEFGDPVDSNLTEEQRAYSLCVQRLFEDHLYWVALYLRWVPDKEWAYLKKAFFGHMPFPLKLFVPDLIRKEMIRNMYGQGVSRHSYDEICEMGKADVKAVATLLGGQPYFIGDSPTTIDAIAFGFLANLIFCPMGSPVKEYTCQCQNLVDHCHRMRDQYFPDLK